MKAIDCAGWYAQMFSDLVELARTRTNLDVRLQLFGPLTCSPLSRILLTPTLLPVTGPRLLSSCPIRDAQIEYRRPDPLTIVERNIDQIIASVCEKGSAGGNGGGLAVGTCGPMALVRTVRSAVGAVERRRAVKA